MILPIYFEISSTFTLNLQYHKRASTDIQSIILKHKSHTKATPSRLQEMSFAVASNFSSFSNKISSYLLAPT